MPDGSLLTSALRLARRRQLSVGEKKLERQGMGGVLTLELYGLDRPKRNSICEHGAYVRVKRVTIMLTRELLK
jgi:hypothetical protein